MNDNDNLRQAIVSISDEILRRGIALAMEERHPEYNADLSDHKMRDLRESIAKLRVARIVLEEVMTGMLPLKSSEPQAALKFV